MHWRIAIIAAVVTISGLGMPSCSDDGPGTGGGAGVGGDGGDGGEACIPVHEICDDIDNDCDEVVDEDCLFWGDTCPNMGVELAPPVAVDIYADTTEANADDSCLCQSGQPDLPLGESAPDYVHALDVKAAGSLVVLVSNAPGSELNAVLYMRAVCEEETSRLWCRDVSREREIFSGHVEAGGYFLFVDGRDGTEGAYSLSIALTEPVCGDGVVNPGEACDDGNFDQGDGCDLCAQEPPQPPDTCGAATISLEPGRVIVLAGTTVNYGDDLDPPTSCVGGTGGRDRVYHIVPTATGQVEATVGYEVDGTTSTCAEKGGGDAGCWDRVLYVRADDCVTGSDQACSNGQAFGDPERVTFDATMNGDYYVVVDGHDASQHAYGSYQLTLELTPP